MEILCSSAFNKHIMLAKSTRFLPIVAAAGISISFLKDRRFSTCQKLNSDEGESWYAKLISSTPTQKVVLSDEVIASKLQKQQFSDQITQCDSTVGWFETNHYNANSPIEDRHCECHFGDENRFFFGVYDGHSGWHCSESLRLRLPLYTALATAPKESRDRFLAGELLASDLVKYLGNPNDDCLSFKMPPTFQEKQAQIKSGTKYFTEKVDEVTANLSMEDRLKFTYLSLDRDITRESIPDGKCNEAIWTGLAGAVAISAYIDGRMLYIANTGNTNTSCSNHFIR